MANSPFMQARKMTNIEIAAANINNAPQNIMTFKGDFDTMKENKRTGCGYDTNNPQSKRSMGKGRSDSCNVKHVGDSSRVESREVEDTLTKTVMNPNLLGRKFYGPQIKVDPNLFTAIATRPVTVPQDTERARVLSNSGNNTEIW
jgi:CRISPR/Cas system CSM-associated protein Csm5 (group 7 of RAMP superfamily)